MPKLIELLKNKKLGEEIAEELQSFIKVEVKDENAQGKIKRLFDDVPWFLDAKETKNLLDLYKDKSKSQREKFTTVFEIACRELIDLKSLISFSISYNFPI